MANTCTNCGMRFLDPEYYRDHLPCETTLQRVERELAEVRAAHARTRAQLDALTARRESPATWRLVIVESPYAGDIGRNVAYARAAMADCLRREEAPIASHLLYTQPGVLRDEIAEERTRGIEAGLAWGRAADAHVFYADLGWSRGMTAARERCEAEGRAWEERRIGEPDCLPPGRESPALVEAARAFVDVADRAEAARTMRTGMQAPYHDDFANMAPSTARALRKWAERLRAALPKEPDHGVEVHAVDAGEEQR